MNSALIIDLLNALVFIALSVFAFLAWRKKLPTSLQRQIGNPPNVSWIISAVIVFIYGIYAIVEVFMGAF